MKFYECYRAFSIIVLLPVFLASGASTSPPTIVHIIPHSHEDPGWLLTADQYYEQRSKAIITNVVTSLEQNSSRIFHYVEQVYFRRWWLAQNDTKQASVRNLVAEKRLMFMTGGLCMNDEATTHQSAIIDQMSWGQRFLNETFGVEALPTVNWQIDAFGHSAGYAKLAQKMGLTSFIGQKIDFQEQLARQAGKALEFTWTPDANSAPAETMLGHLMWDNTQGYSFMQPHKCGANTGVQGANCTTLPLRSMNCTGATGTPGGNGCCTKMCGVHDVDNCDSCAVEVAVNLIVERVQKIVAEYAHGASDIFFPFGSDFSFQDAPLPFESMEICMAVINDAQRRGSGEYGNIKLIYSSPAAYFAAITTPNMSSSMHTTTTTASASASAPLPRYDGDFFPSTFSTHYIRSGYFSSRPAGKALDRIVWGNGDAAKRLRTLLALAPSINGAAAVVAQLDAAVAAVDATVGVHQHHDAISGTDLASVSDNYRAMMVFADALALPAAAAASALLAGVATSSTTARAFTGCPLANVSVCEGTDALAHGKAVTMVLFNPLAGEWRTEVVAVPIPISAVHVSEGLKFEVHEAVLRGNEKMGSKFTLFVEVRIPPLSTQTLVLTPVKTSAGSSFVRFTRASSSSAAAAITLTVPGGASATVGGQTGSLTSVNGRPVTSSLEFYIPEPGTNKSHGWGNTNDCSSAYAFRPRPGGTHKFHPASAPAATVMVAKGTLVQQTYVQVSASAHVELVVRVVAGDRSVRLISKIGALDISNGDGQEAVMLLEACDSSPSLSSPCAFDRTWWTDANGLQMMKRAWRDNSTVPTTALGTPYVVWEPEAQNYYPATAAAALVAKDVVIEPRANALVVAFNAAHGVTSRRSGSLELMLHRRLVDHGCRVDEGFEMNDLHPVIFELRVRAPGAKSVETAASAYRGDALRMMHPLQAYFGPAPRGGEHVQRVKASTERTAMEYVLPSNVHLHTMRARGTDLEEHCDPFSARGLKECTDDIVSRAAAVASKKNSANGELSLELILRFQHLYAVGEDATLSQPTVVNINAFLASISGGLVVRSAAETTLTAANVIDPAPKLGEFALAPLEIRTLVVEVSRGAFRAVI